MSKQKIVNIADFSPQAPIPVREPKPMKTGNGTATFKTASAAAKAAMQARDETRSLNAAAHANAKTAAEAQARCLQACREVLEIACEFERRNTYLVRFIVWGVLGATLFNIAIHFL